MTFISLDLFYRFSNICTPWYVKNSKIRRVKFCWFPSIVFISIPICLDNFTDIPVTYSSESGICFIEPQLYLLIFFIGPSMFMFFINVICFIGTIINIYRAQPDGTLINATSDRNMALIFARIGGLMGVTWLFALIPYVTGIQEFWYLFIITNGLQGVYIFLSSGIIGHLRSTSSQRVSSRRQTVTTTVREVSQAESSFHM